MKKTLFAMAGLAIFLSAWPVCAKELKPIPLPAPDKTGGKPLMQVLAQRSSNRSFSSDKLPLNELSNLLWAGFGINRPATGDRTAPSTRNWQEIDIYVATAEGLYLYDFKANTLQPVTTEDLRAKTGSQPFVSAAPVNLIFVSDHAKMSKIPSEAKDIYSAADTGFISQNVYLYCASAGLSSVVHAGIDKDNLAKAMKLRPDQKITFAHAVGFPAKRP